MATISPDLPFLPNLIKALFEGRLIKGFTCSAKELENNPFHLADVTLYLPTRRAVREAEHAFLATLQKTCGVKAALLPNIQAIGDVDESDLLLSQHVRDPSDILDDLVPATPQLTRVLALSRLIWSWSQRMHATLKDAQDLQAQEQVIVPANMADAARLAADLAELLDEADTYAIDWRDLSKIAPDSYARYWQLSLSFLHIATEAWPLHLQEIGQMDEMARRNKLVRAKAAGMRSAMPGHPVIAAGSTGSIPATGEFLAAIAGLPQGAVVLPGLDMDLTEEVFQTIGKECSKGKEDPSLLGHPQAALKHTLSRIGVKRGEVKVLTDENSSSPNARFRLLNEALRPAAATADWNRVVKNTLLKDHALENIGLIEAKNAAEEARAIALGLRARLETHPANKCVLATPDRKLAERVSVELLRLGITADDSAGKKLFQTPAGRLARLSVNVAQKSGQSVALLALLKHPMTGISSSRAEIGRAARALERALLRGPARAGNLKDKIDQLTQLHNAICDQTSTHEQRPNVAQEQLYPSDWQSAKALLEIIAVIFEPFEALFAPQARQVSLAQCAKIHLSVLRALTEGPETFSSFNDSKDGEALIDALSTLKDTGRDFIIPASDYGSMLKAMIGQIPVRQGSRPQPGESNIQILGILEARLVDADFIVLGGLNEKTWPSEHTNSPFLSRSMRKALGLPSAERALGLSAHDFVQLASKSNVLLTRSMVADGSPTQAARWLQRVDALINDDGMKRLRHQGQIWLNLARSLDSHGSPAGSPTNRPNPKPPITNRPTRLSVTEIETLIRDPYAIYARHILRLRPFEQLEEIPSFATRGTIIHDILHRFVEQQKADKFAFDSLEAKACLKSIADHLFASLKAFPDIYASWRNRFDRITVWLHELEAKRDLQTLERHVEVVGSLRLPELSFELTARADRIDITSLGFADIIDYKTGTPPSKKMVQAHLAPQLSLEAAILASGGFVGLAPMKSNQLSYIQLSGAKPPGRVYPILQETSGIKALAEEALERLRQLIVHYSRGDVGYPSHLQPMKKNHGGHYDQLARLAEWSHLSNQDIPS